MNFLVLLWVGNFDYIGYKIIDRGGIGRYETRVFPDGHPREWEQRVWPPDLLQSVQLGTYNPLYA
ncbi:MAG: hypothetical protein MUO64_03490 [Anaerolineales bacterium]|nr:hypothetical protein [Anaerolineales bacterium]